jgi:DNA invertase Pin-like site-specific DNA recombinase
MIQRFSRKGKTMLIGYARVSTTEQEIALQMDALSSVGCERTFEDRMSGAKNDRPGLADALSHARPGDTLVVWKLDRLGRSLRDLVELVGGLAERRVEFRSLTDGIDTSTPSGRFFFHIMGAMAQMERELIAERTMAGLAAARRRGKVGGRKPKMTERKIDAARKLLDAGTPAREVADQLGVSVPTLYRHVPAETRRVEG